MHAGSDGVTGCGSKGLLPHSAEVKPPLGEEDLVNVSYMEDELDLDTVGDIIAIMENKAGQVVVIN